LWREQGVMLGLVLLLILIYLAQAIGGRGWYDVWMCTPAAVTDTWSALRGQGADAIDWQALSTLLTCAFLHGSAEHLASNLLFLWIFGALLNELLGWRWLLGLFVITAIGASSVHVALDPRDWTPMLGASGALMGFEGTYLALATRFHLPDPHIWPIARPVSPARLAALAVIGVGFDYYAIFGGSAEMIAFGAHVGGFTTGLLVGGTLIPCPAAGRRR
jgi:membrane associated rhomboid family serine protease